MKSLAEIRRRRGVSLAEAAKRLGSTLARVNRIERDPLEATLADLIEYGDALGLRLSLRLGTHEVLP